MQEPVLWQAMLLAWLLLSVPQQADRHWDVSRQAWLACQHPRSRLRLPSDAHQHVNRQILGLLPCSVRCCGSCAMNLVGVACGRLDAFYEIGFGGCWDVAAGVCVCGLHRLAHLDGCRQGIQCMRAWVVSVLITAGITLTVCERLTAWQHTSTGLLCEHVICKGRHDMHA